MKARKWEGFGIVELRHNSVARHDVTQIKKNFDYPATDLRRYGEAFTRFESTTKGPLSTNRAFFDEGDFDGRWRPLSFGRWLALRTSNHAKKKQGSRLAP